MNDEAFQALTSRLADEVMEKLKAYHAMVRDEVLRKVQDKSTLLKRREEATHVE